MGGGNNANHSLLSLIKFNLAIKFNVAIVVIEMQLNLSDVSIYSSLNAHRPTMRSSFENKKINR